MYGYVNRGDTTNICRRNKNFNLRDARVEHADRRKNSSSRIWSAGSEFLTGSSDFRPGHARLTLRTRPQFPPHSIFTARTPSVRPPVPSSFIIEGRKERVLLARRISRIFVMEGEASSRASSTSGRPTLWSRRNRELERDKGELGWKLGVVRESIWESNSREMGRIFFSNV